MKRNEILDRTLGNLTMALAEESKRFVFNKREVHPFSAEVLSDLQRCRVALQALDEQERTNKMYSSD